MQKFLDYLMKASIAFTFGLSLLLLFRKDLFLNFIEWVKAIVLNLGDWNYLVVFLSSMIESFPVIGVFVPGQNILLIAGGFFAEQSTEKLLLVVLFAALGAILGNFIGFYLGQKYGEGFFKRYGLWMGIGETEVEYLKKGIEKWGAVGIVVGKFYPMTRAFLPFIAGSMGMKSKKFMIYNTLGSIIWALVIVLLGLLFAKTYEIVIEYIGRAFMLGFLAFGIYVYFYKKEEFKIYWKKKNDEIEKKMNF